MLSTKRIKTIHNHRSAGVREMKRLLDRFDPFVAASRHIVCTECDEFIPADEYGNNYDHNCLDPRMVRSAYEAWISELRPLPEYQRRVRAAAQFVVPL